MVAVKLWWTLAIAAASVPAAAAPNADPAQLTRLGAGEIRQALVGRRIAYSPPRWSDAGVHEEFHPDGRWQGIYYGRGPMPVAGRWALHGNRVCVVPTSGYLARSSFPRTICRSVWRNRRTGRLLIDHVSMKGAGLMAPTIDPLPPERARPSPR